MDFLQQHMRHNEGTTNVVVNTTRLSPREVPVYGHELRKEAFALYSTLVNFNHGSFGTVPVPVLDAHFKFMLEQESCPEIWFRQSYERYVNVARREIAKLIAAHEDDVVLVENASYAVNAILRSFPFQKGDKILLFSSAYRMVVDTLKYLESTVGVEVVAVAVAYPVLSAEELVSAVGQELQRHESIRMCVFSHISSMPTMIEPVKELTALCKQQGAVVLIDGAHAPGVLDIDVDDIGADYYTGNCHKWLFAPKGSAFLWTARRTQTLLHPQPVVISSSGRYDYVGRFAYTGTRDYTAFATIPHALSFVDCYLGGMAAMRTYCTTLLKQGCDLLVTRWNTGYLVPFEMQAFMANVILPLSSEEQALALQQRLMQQAQISMVYGSVAKRPDEVDAARSRGVSVSQDKIFFIRVSAQVYLEMSDFELLAKTVADILSSRA